MSEINFNTGTAYDDYSPEQRAQFLAAFNKDLPRTTDEWLDSLSRLSPVEYDQKRIAVAERIGIRVSTLDEEVEKRKTKTGDHSETILSEPEPWPSEIAGSELLDQVERIFNLYVILPPGAAAMLALWTVHTYLLDGRDVSPIVAVSSPEKRCGKTIVLELLQALVYRPLPAANVTAAAVFRSIESFQPTLLMDEADKFIRDNEELRGVLNSGHRRRQAFVLRCDGDNHEPRRFSTWCAKAIALIGRLPSTIEDRSIVINMRRKSRDEKVASIHQTLFLETAVISRKAARWAADNVEQLKLQDPTIPNPLNDRAADCWRPLLAIADLAGGGWPEIARQAVLSLAKRTADDGSTSVQLL